MKDQSRWNNFVPQPGGTRKELEEHSRILKNKVEKDMRVLDAVYIPDDPLPEDKQIAATHPLMTGNFSFHDEAQRLVSAKHSKFALVDLVRWLLTKIDNLEKQLQESNKKVSPLICDIYKASIDEGGKHYVDGPGWSTGYSSGLILPQSRFSSQKDAEAGAMVANEAFSAGYKKCQEDMKKTLGLI